MLKIFLRSASALLILTAVIHAQFPTTANPKIVTAALPAPSSIQSGQGIPNMGLAFLSDGRMVVLSSAINTSPGNGAMGQGYVEPADGNNAIYLVSGLSRAGSLTGATFTKILDSMTGPPPGVLVVNDTIYVADRDGFYRVNSLTPAKTARSQNATRIINVPTLDSTFTWNRGPTGHQWIFTPVYYKGRFYSQYSGCIIPGGTSNAPPTSTLAGSILSWSKDTILPLVPVDPKKPNAGYTREAGGVRSPNGFSSNGEYMVGTDNQGSFNPGNPIRMYKPGQPLVTYGTRQSTTTNAGGATGITNTLRNWAEDLPYQPPLIWVPYGPPNNSLTQPLYLTFGPYQGDWIMGDATDAGMGRLHVDNVDNSGNYQGSYHLFAGTSINSTGATETKAINRMAISPDSAIYVGTLLHPGNWPSGNPGPIFRITFRDTATFEILALRSRKSADGTVNGVEVFFSQPVNPSTVTTANFALLQSDYMLGANYGCNTTLCSTRTPQVTSVALSNDNRKVFVGISTPDTSIGAAHIGTLGVGNLPRGVWGAAGAQDRTLQVTVNNNVKSATGASMFYNVAWMGWFYQAQTRFDPANTDVTVSISKNIRPEAAKLASSLTIRSIAGVLNVDLDLPGQATVALYSVNGTLEEELTGTGSFRFNTPLRGLHILRVKQGSAVYSRPVML